MYGTVELIGAQKVSQEELEQNYEKHRIDDLSIVSYPQCWAWEFFKPVKFDPPVRILPQRHCRVWVHLQYPMAEKSIEVLLTQVAVASDLDSLKEVGQNAGIACMEKGKNPYWRLLMKDKDILEKYHYSKDSFDSQKDSLRMALARMQHMARHLDTVSCMQVPELKELLGQLGLCKVGQQEVLRDRALQHLYHHKDEAHVGGEMVPVSQNDENLATAAPTVAPTTAAAVLPKAKAKCAKVDVAEEGDLQGSNGGTSNTNAHTSESKGPSPEAKPSCKYFEPRQIICKDVL